MGNNIGHQFYGGDYVAELLDTIMTWLHSTESVEILLRSKFIDEDTGSHNSKLNIIKL